VNYFSEPWHGTWQTHYFHGRNGGVLLAFSRVWKDANLPKGIGEKGFVHGTDQLLVVLRDNEQGGKLLDTKMSIAYDNGGAVQHLESWMSVLDEDWNPIAEGILSLQSYFYACHHCPCHRKQDAREQCGVETDDVCEGNRFAIERIAPLDQRDLILYSETVTVEELEELLKQHRSTQP
jgi:hypothetical protein